MRIVNSMTTQASRQVEDILKNEWPPELLTNIRFHHVLHTVGICY